MMTDALVAPVRDACNCAFDPWSDRVQQKTYRSLLGAFAEPGHIATLPIPRASQSAASATLLAILATLVDDAVTLTDPESRIPADDRLRLGARIVPSTEAAFVVADGATPPAFEPRLGTLESPEQGATLILVVDALTQCATSDVSRAAPEETPGVPLWTLTGPGIRAPRALDVCGLHPGWIAARNRWNDDFPRGCDWILVAPGACLALPRTTQMHPGSEHANTSPAPEAWPSLDTSSNTEAS